MKTNLFNRTANLLRNAVGSAALMIASAAFLTGCGNGLSGKYGNEMMTIEFKSGSTAFVSMGIEGINRVTTEVKYGLKGDKLTLRGAGAAGNLILTVNQDGTLGGSPMEVLAGPLKKQLGSRQSR